MGHVCSAESPTQRCLCALLTLRDIHVIFTRLHCGTDVAVQLLSQELFTRDSPNSGIQVPKHNLPPR